MQGARFPYQVARTAKQVDGGLGVPQRLGMTAQDPERVAPANQESPGGHAAAATQHLVEQDKAALCLPGQEQGHAQAREDVGLSGEISRLARQPACFPQFVNGFIDVTKVPENHADHLMGNRSLGRRGMLRQCVTGIRKRFRWFGQRPGQQFVRIPRHLSPLCLATLTNRNYREGSQSSKLPGQKERLCLRILVCEHRYS